MSEIDQAINQGYVRVAKHPTKDLFIYNYTPKAQFENHWTETIKKCRGLVLNSKGETIIECIPKFFNQDDPLAPNITLENSTILEKLDGYYISIKQDSTYGLVITSRGSFQNKYVEAVPKFLKNVTLKEDYTYFCELCENFVGDESIIVTKHPAPRLVCWAVKSPENIELPLSESPLPIAKEFSFLEAKEYLKGESEGVVLVSNGERVKVKTEWYLKMHRLISDCTKKRVYDLLLNGESVKDLDIPNEFMTQMVQWESELKETINSQYEHALKLYQETKALTDKEIGLSDIAPGDKALVFAFRKGKDPMGMILKNMKYMV